TAVRYPKRPEEEVGALDDPELPCGVRLGIIARDSDGEAWAVAHERFPADRKGQLLHQLAMKASDSEWHRQLSERAGQQAENDPYWLFPFQNYKTFCPYLVGSYGRVAELLAGYMKLGCRTFILDIPPCEVELQHTRVVFEEAKELAWPA
ncbi:MAG: alkanesulfonate monooxygenase, partial [Planctomycetota bacterium]